MNERTRHMRAGTFLVGSVLLVLAILFFLGGRNLFVKKIKVCTYFAESVQGLSRGAAVKFKGAPIGKVSDIRIIFPDYVLVEMEIDVSRFASSDERGFEAAFIHEVREEGLCCRLEYVGITGLKFVDFDYHKAEKKNPEPPAFIGETGAIYVPSVNSSFADISTSIAGAIDKINQLNLKEISAELTGALREIRALLADPALKSTIAHLNGVAANLETTSGVLGRIVDEEQLKTLIAGLEETLKSLQTFIQRMDEATVGANIPESAAALRDTAVKVSQGATEFRSAMSAATEARRELGNTLLKLNQTLDSLQMLINYIESDPSSLMRGKSRPKEKK